jgi:hypothetical protein
VDGLETRHQRHRRGRSVSDAQQVHAFKTLEDLAHRELAGLERLHEQVVALLGTSSEQLENIA